MKINLAINIILFLSNYGLINQVKYCYDECGPFTVILIWFHLQECGVMPFFYLYYLFLLLYN